MTDILLRLFLPLSLAFIMFSLGLGLRLTDFGAILRQPRAAILGIGNQMIILPIVGFAIAILLGLPPALAMGMMILALAPGGMTSNMMTRIMGGNTALSIAMTGVVTLVSIITVPLLVRFFFGYFLGDAAPAFSVIEISATMFALVVIPVALGMLMRRFAPNATAKSERAFMVLAVILFVLVVLAALGLNWGPFLDNLPVIGPAVVLLNVIMLILGVTTARMAGIGTRDAATISVETGIQNSTLAIAVVGLIFGSVENLPPETVPAAVYGLTMYFVTLPFVYLAAGWIRNSES